jgi:DNA-binding XRE family transcriptional regulator
VICDNGLTALLAAGWRNDVSKPQATEQASRALGAELAAYRRAAGYSQARLAEVTEYSRSTIANVETGRQHVPRIFWERADRALRTGGVLANAHDQAGAAARRDLRAAARTMSTARQARTWQYPPDGRAAQDQAATPLSCWPTEPGPAAAPRPAQAPSALTPPAAGSRPASPGDVARLKSMRQHLKEIDNAHGGGAALPMAAWYLRTEIPPLLNGNNGANAGRALIEVAAECQHDLGWMAYDASQQRLATEYFRHALRSARAAGNRLLGARVLAAMSHQAIYLGQLRQAIDFAQAARAATAPAPSATPSRPPPICRWVRSTRPPQPPNKSSAKPGTCTPATSSAKSPS